MLLPLVFALAAPPSFVHAVEARLAAAHMHVVDWWADDLDGDHVPESIALVCDADTGFFLVQHGNDLLEAPVEIDGRNSCPEAPPTTPAWRVVKSGVISENVNVHHGRIGYSFAIRDGRLVLVRRDLAERLAPPVGARGVEERHLGDNEVIRDHGARRSVVEPEVGLGRSERRHVDVGRAARDLDGARRRHRARRTQRCRVVDRREVAADLGASSTMLLPSGLRPRSNDPSITTSAAGTKAAAVSCGVAPPHAAASTAITPALVMRPHYAGRDRRNTASPRDTLGSAHATLASLLEDKVDPLRYAAPGSIGIIELRP
jgi:hypothetical protein